VVFQPFSGVTHAESTTYGGKGKEEQKQALMDSGRRKFHDKWRSTLRFHGNSKISHAPVNEKWLKVGDTPGKRPAHAMLFSWRAWICIGELRL